MITIEILCLLNSIVQEIIYQCRAPYCYDTMKEAAEKKTEDLPFARIGFYEVEGNPYFGKVFLYPRIGYETFQPEKWDYTLGSWIDLTNN